MVFTQTKPTYELRSSLKKTEHILRNKYPKKHHHYSFEDFFSFHSETGTIN